MKKYSRYFASVSSLYGLQIATLVLPLVLLPFLTRRLGADAWGALAIQTSLSTLLIVVIEYGFGFGATREGAELREDKKGLGQLFTNVIGARLLLSAAVAVLWTAIWLLVPAVHLQPVAYWWTLALTMVQGLSPAWFYQAVARLPYVMMRELIARIASTVLILLLVQNHTDAWLVPLLQFATLAAMLAVTTESALRTIDRRLPTVKGVFLLLRSSAHLCFTRLVQLIAPMGNTFLLGVIAPGIAPIYGAAERTSVATRGLLSPVLQVAFPEIVVLYREIPARARSAVRRILYFLVMGAVLLAAVLWLLAGVVVFVLFGTDFASSVPVFRVMLISVPLFAIIQVVGLQWLIPLKHDRAYLVSAILGMLLNIASALVLVPQFGALGMAWSLVISEFSVAAGLLLYTEFFGPRLLRILRTTSLHSEETRTRVR